MSAEVRARLRDAREAIEGQDGVTTTVGRGMSISPDGESWKWIHVDCHLNDVGEISVLSDSNTGSDRTARGDRIGAAMVKHDLEIIQIRPRTETTSRVSLWLAPKEQSTDFEP